MTVLSYALDQIFEWIHGRTHIEYGVSEVTFRYDTEANAFKFRIESNRVRCTKIRHPLALVVEEVQIIIEGYAESTNKTKKSFATKLTKGLLRPSIKDLDTLTVKADQSGYATITVQTEFYATNSTFNTLPTFFVFRNNLLNHIR